VLTSVTAYDLHAETARHHLALATILEARVLGGPAGIVFQLSPLVSALIGDLHDGAARSRLGVRDGEGVGNGCVTERVQHVIRGVHVRRPLFPDAGL
jgi:hypothetical protein